MVQTSTDIEVFLRISQPFRTHDQIIITFPSVFDLTEVTSVWSEFGGYDPFKYRYLPSVDDVWKNNSFYGKYPATKYNGYLSTYY